jgi:hypothetical protein
MNIFNRTSAGVPSDLHGCVIRKRAAVTNDGRIALASHSFDAARRVD